MHKSSDYALNDSYIDVTVTIYILIMEYNEYVVMTPFDSNAVGIIIIIVFKSILWIL